MNLEGKKILFIGPRTFGYENDIKEELERFGCYVDWYDERPSASSFAKALIRMHPSLYEFRSNAYYDRIIEKKRDYEYNYVFVIKGEALSISRLSMLRKKYANAIFIFYTWDSLRNVKNCKEKLDYFDKAYSFDRYDCDSNKNVTHLSLFYTRDYEELADAARNDNEGIRYKLLMLGSLHSDRYTIANNIIKACRKIFPSITVLTYYYFQSRWVYLVRKIAEKNFRLIPYKDVSWNTMGKEQALSLTQRSEILIDVHHPKQTGLTMRTIECVGAEKKIITTNPEVKKYDFYNENNILVVDRKNPVITREFLTTPYQRLDQSIYDKYSLKEWLKEVFSTRNESYL